MRLVFGPQVRKVSLLPAIAAVGASLAAVSNGSANYFAKLWPTHTAHEAGLTVDDQNIRSTAREIANNSQLVVCAKGCR